MNIRTVVALLCAGLAIFVVPHPCFSQDDDRFKGKSKKDLQAEIIQIETTGEAQVSDLTRQLEAETRKAATLEKSNASKDMELAELQEKLASQEMDLSGLQAELASSEEEVNTLREALDLLQSQTNSPSDIGRGVVGDVFDFRFEMGGESAWGSNPIRITPVGWSPDGKFCYLQEYCSGGCGCCSMSLNVFDAEGNVLVLNEYFDTEGYEEIDSGAELASTRTGIATQLVNAFKTYGIFPLGVGHYQPNTNANQFKCNPAMWQSESFEVDVVKGPQEWNIIAKSGSQPNSVLATVDISINEMYGTESPESVAVPGVITNPWGNHTLAVYFTETLGYEAEQNWNLNLATVPRRFIAD